MSNRQFVLVIIVTFVVIIIWIIADILHTKPSVEVNPKFETLLQPIDPNFDQKVISQIKDVTPLTDLASDAFTQTTTASTSARTAPTIPLPSVVIPSSIPTGTFQIPPSPSPATSSAAKGPL